MLPGIVTTISRRIARPGSHAFDFVLFLRAGVEYGVPVFDRFSVGFSVFAQRFVDFARKIFVKHETNCNRNYRRAIYQR